MTEDSTTDKKGKVYGPYIAFDRSEGMETTLTYTIEDGVFHIIDEKHVKVRKSNADT